MKHWYFTFTAFDHSRQIALTSAIVKAPTLQEAETHLLKYTPNLVDIFSVVNLTVHNEQI